MYVASVALGSRHRKFLVKADSIPAVKEILARLNMIETRMGEKLFESVDYIESVEFELDVMEI